MLDGEEQSVGGGFVRIGRSTSLAVSFTENTTWFLQHLSSISQDLAVAGRLVGSARTVLDLTSMSSIRRRKRCIHQLSSKICAGTSACVADKTMRSYDERPHEGDTDSACEDGDGSVPWEAVPHLTRRRLCERTGGVDRS